MIWVWNPVCVLTGLILALGCYEIVLGPGNHIEVSQNELVGYENFSNFLFVFLIDGLRNGSGLQPANLSSRGVFTVPLSYPRVSVVGATAGKYDNVLTLLLSMPSKSDTIFEYVDTTYFFGAESTRRFFPDNVVWQSETYPDEWLDGFPEKYGHLEKPDQFVMEKVMKVLREDRENIEKKRKCVFLIQLTTIDLSAKAEGINSPKVADAVLSVETFISKMETFVEKRYRWNASYVIMSTHGTDEYGRSGGTTRDQVHIPVFVWGKGTKTGRQGGLRPAVDLCPLLASILGVPVPKHSRGKLPRFFLSYDLQPLALASNALQLGALCTAMTRNSGPLSRKLMSLPLNESALLGFRNNLTVNLHEKNLEEVFKDATNLIEISQSCISKIEGFYSGSILFTLAMGYIAWISLLGTNLTPEIPTVNQRWTWLPILLTVATHLLFVLKIIVVAFLVYIESWPLYLLPVFELPVFLWWFAASKVERVWMYFVGEGFVKLAIYVMMALLVIEITKWMETRLYFSMLFLLPYVAWTTAMNARYVPMHVTGVWIGTSLLLLISHSFLWQLGLSGKPSTAILNVGAAIWIIGGCLSAYRMDLRAKEHIVTAILALIGTLTICVVDLYHVGVWSSWMVFISWFILCTPFLTYFGSNTLSTRLIQVCMALSFPLVLVSLGQEPLTFLLLSVNLYAWLRLEASSPQYEHQEYLRCLAFYFYICYAISVLGPAPIVITYSHVISQIFVNAESVWVNVALVLIKTSLSGSIVVAFWTAVSLYVGSKPEYVFKSWLVLTAMFAARHALSVVLNEEPDLSDLLQAHLLFTAVLIPFCLIPFLLLVTKYKQIQ